MSKITWFTFLIGLSFFCVQSAISQDVNFSIHLGEKEIGEVKARRTALDNTHIYEVKSDVNFKVLWKEYNRTTNNKVIYENDILMSSYNSVYMNEEMEDSSAFQKKEEQYHYYRFPNEKLEMPKGLVQVSTVTLYFAEPEGINSIFSERFLTFCPLELIKEHTYKLSLPNGKVNIYTYVNKKLAEVFVDRSWFDLKFLQKK